MSFRGSSFVQRFHLFVMTYLVRNEQLVDLTLFTYGQSEMPISVGLN